MQQNQRDYIMELVANIWPVVDQNTWIVQRFLIRAYAMAATDEEISTILTTLARSDYRTAPSVAIPYAFKLSSEHGDIAGAISIAGFHKYVGYIIEGALRTIEQSFAELHNYGLNSEGKPQPLEALKFPDNPYCVTTALLEYPSGELKPHLLPALGA